MKFQIGDHIEANRLSNGVYTVTNERRAWRGYVIKTMDGGRIGVASEAHLKSTRDKGFSDEPEWWVKEQYFDLLDHEEELAAPDGDLFAELFG